MKRKTKIVHKTLLLLAIFCCSVGVQAQKLDFNFSAAGATSIAGVQFGASKSTVLSALKNRFGSDYALEGNVATFYDVTIGGQFYKYVEFYFAYNPSKQQTILVAAHLTVSYYLSARQNAFEGYKGLTSTYSSKYPHSYDLEPDAECPGLWGCTYKTDFSKSLIVISCCKGETRGGDERYFVSVVYYPDNINAISASDI